MKNKVIIHNLTFPGDGRSPGVMDFDQRSILCASPRDIIVTKSLISSSYLDYISDLGWNFKGIKLLTGKNIKNNEDYTFNYIFKKKSLIKFLKNKKKYFLDTYHLTNFEKNFATIVNMPISTNVSLAQKYGTKSGFRKLAKLLSLPIPMGFNGLKTTNEILKSVDSVFRDGVEVIVIKHDHGSSGYGNFLIYKKKFFQKSLNEKKQVIKNNIKNIYIEGYENSFTAETWINKVEKSPALIFYLDKNKNVELVSFYDQILDRKSKKYIGCNYPISNIKPFLKKAILDDSQKLAEFLSKKGFTGYFGLDLVLANDKYYFIEANIRKPDTYYPELIRKKLFQNKKTSYLYRSFYYKEFFNKDFIFLKNILKKVLFKKNKGVVIFNTGAFSEIGRFDLVIFGSSLLESYFILFKANIFIKISDSLQFFLRKLFVFIKKTGKLFF